MSVESQSLQGEKYLSARLLERFCKHNGERGSLLVATYNYLRLVDDVVDGANVSGFDSNSYISRQINILDGNVKPDLGQKEDAIVHNLRWEVLGGMANDAKFQVKNILSSIQDDALHSNFEPRNNREIRHYNWRTLYSAINLTSIVLNGEPLKPTKEFMSLLDSWNRLGSLIDIQEDLENGQIKLPVAYEYGENENSEESTVRKLKASVFDKQLVDSLVNIMTNSGSFFHLNIPLWQQIVSFFYIMLRVPTKAVIKGINARQILMSKF